MARAKARDPVVGLLQASAWGITNHQMRPELLREGTPSFGRTVVKSSVQLLKARCFSGPSDRCAHQFDPVYFDPGCSQRKGEIPASAIQIDGADGLPSLGFFDDPRHERVIDGAIDLNETEEWDSSENLCRDRMPLHHWVAVWTAVGELRAWVLGAEVDEEVGRQ